jgi:predicted ATPase
LIRASERKTFLACYDSVLARVLTAAGRLDAARERADLALAMADETGMHYYDAELLRIRAHTHRDPTSRCEDLLAALQTAQKQGAWTFELRCAIDCFIELGEPGRELLADAVARFDAEHSWPELARARALLG